MSLEAGLHRLLSTGNTYSLVTCSHGADAMRHRIAEGHIYQAKQRAQTMPDTEWMGSLQSTQRVDWVDLKCKQVILLCVGLLSK